MSEGVYVFELESTEESINNITVLYCRTAQEVKTIVNRTLGGLWFNQVIGSSAIKAEVELYIKGMTARDTMLGFYASGRLITIEYDGYKRTGFIASEPSVELVSRARDLALRNFVMKFSFGVDQEEAIV